MEKILLVIPSRGRPQLMTNLIRSWEETTSGHSKILMGLDTNDPLLLNYPIGYMKIGFGAPKKELNEKNNYLSLRGVEIGYEIIGCLSDDFIFHTPGWEEKIIEWQDNNKGICYGDDLLQGPNLPTCPFIHSNIIKALGYAAPSELIHYYIDNYWLELGMRLNKLKYFPEIIIEHRHWSNGKTQKDEVYLLSESLMGIDQATWDEYRITKLALDVQKIEDYEKKTNQQCREGLVSLLHYS